MKTNNNWLSVPTTNGLHWYSERFRDGNWSIPCIVEVVLDEGLPRFKLNYVPPTPGARADMYLLDISGGEDYIICANKMKFLHIAPPETPCS